MPVDLDVTAAATRGSDSILTAVRTETMSLWFKRPVRYLVDAVRDNDSPRQLASGVALGMLIGLVPKDNLTAALLGVLLLALKTNLAAAALSAFCFSWIGGWTDPLTHRIGYWLLTWPALQSLYSGLFELPLVPWTKLNNTVVAGSLVFGLALFYPVYEISRVTVEVVLPKLADRWRRSRCYHFVYGRRMTPSGEHE